MLINKNGRTWSAQPSEVKQFIESVKAEIEKENKNVIYALETGTIIQFERTEFNEPSPMLALIEEYESNGVKVHYHAGSIDIKEDDTEESDPDEIEDTSN